MIKKTKLYSLLLIIVLSTVVGVFGFGGTAKAAPEKVNGSSNTICGGAIAPIPFKDTGEVPARNGFNLLTNDLEGMAGAVREDAGEDSIIYWCMIGPVVTGEPGKLKRQGYLEVIYFDEGTSDDTIIKFIENVPENTDKVLLYDLCEESDPESGQVTGGRSLCTSDPIKIDEKRLNDADIFLGQAKEPSTLCQIKSVGWLICPVVFFLAEATDSAYTILDKTLLKVEPLALPGSSSDASVQLYNSWKMIRDFANIIFIIFFLFIVFSQITNVGISNYGIKKLLPRIVLAAILVNVSYFVCVVAVDASNVIGNSLRGLFDSAVVDSNSGGPFSFTVQPDGGGDGIEVTSWSDIAYLVIGGAGGAIALVATTAMLYAFLPIFLPMILGVAVAVFTVVIALTLRQALIVILVVVSPLAFVAMLLPNTENIFQKWRSLFTAMLLIYPIIATIFGASALAGSILMATDDFPVQLVGAGVSIIPLFLTPIVMKASGGLLNSWVGLVNNPSKGPVDGMRKSLQRRGERWEGNRKISALTDEGGRFGKNTGKLGINFGSRYRSAVRNDAIDAGVKAEASRASGQYVAAEIMKNEGNNDFSKQVAASDDLAATQRAQARAQSTIARGQREDVQAARTTISHLDGDAIFDMLNVGGHSDEKTAALLERLVSVGSTKQVAAAVNKYASGGQQTIATLSLAQALQKDGPKWLLQPDIEEISRGQIGHDIKDKDGKVTGKVRSFEQKTESNLAGNVMSESRIASESDDALEYANEIAAKAAAEGRTSAQKVFGANAKAALANPQLQGQIENNKEQVTIAAARVSAAAPTTPPVSPAGPGIRPGDV